MIRTWKSTDAAFSALNVQPDNMLNHKELPGKAILLFRQSQASLQMSSNAVRIVKPIGLGVRLVISCVSGFSDFHWLWYTDS